jgi:hypothetical protein
MIKRAPPPPDCRRRPAVIRFGRHALRSSAQEECEASLRNEVRDRISTSLQVIEPRLMTTGDNDEAHGFREPHLLLCNGQWLMSLLAAPDHECWPGQLRQFLIVQDVSWRDRIDASKHLAQVARNGLTETGVSRCQVRHLYKALWSRIDGVRSNRVC